MKHIFLGLIVSLFSATTYSQNVNLDWAKSTGGSSSDFGRSISIDVSGNLYVVGDYAMTADFDPSSSTFNLTSNGSADIFIQKLDSNGNFMWAKSMGGTMNDGGTSIATDASGNVYVTGIYGGTVDFDPNSSTFNLISNGGTDIFIQKLDSNGNFVWAKSMGGTMNDVGNSIATDASGNVYVSGVYGGIADFDPSSSIFNLTSNGRTDVFIQKLDSNGNFKWAKSMGGTENDGGSAIATDASGNVYVTGGYVGTVDFDPSSSIFNLTSNGSAEIFIQKLDSNGNFMWAKSLGGTMNDVGNSIATDASGNVYVVGDYETTVDFDPGSSAFNLTSIGSTDIFIQKLDSSGNFIWAKSIGGMGAEQSNSISIDTSGSVYVVGVYSGTADFDPGSSTFSLTSNGSTDAFIQKLDSNGHFKWAKSLGERGVEAGTSISVGISGNLYVAGWYERTVDFDPSSSTFNLTSNGRTDIFVQKLKNCAVNVNVTKDHLTITANATGASYQWLDCNNNHAIISGETSQTFTALINGDYAVEVTENGCTGISACVNISAVGTEEIELLNSITIYPNPTSNQLTIVHKGTIINEVSIVDITGKIHQTREKNIDVFDVSELPKGIYFIKVLTRKGMITKKIVRN